ncbi:unnamed protein product [Caenorhabditis brenneri]
MYKHTIQRCLVFADLLSEIEDPGALKDQKSPFDSRSINKKLDVFSAWFDGVMVHIFLVLYSPKATSRIEVRK